MTRVANFALFDGYESVEPAEWTIGLQSSTSPDEPHGTMANVHGVMTYADGYTGTFEALLVQENGSWRLFRIDVEVPPEKVEDYLKSNPF